jgi:hypothetical protein
VHRSSESVAGLAAALARAQAELVNPEKSLTGTIRGAGPGAVWPLVRFCRRNLSARDPGKPGAESSRGTASVRRRARASIRASSRWLHRDDIATGSICGTSRSSHCLVCGRKPSDPHHLRHVQPRALGRKASDEFAVPLCRSHHRAVHRASNEQAWWNATGIEPTKIARKLWKHTRVTEGRIRLGGRPQERGSDQRVKSAGLDESAGASETLSTQTDAP